MSPNRWREVSDLFHRAADLPPAERAAFLDREAIGPDGATDAALREKLLACLSTRAAANIRDDMEALGPVKLSDVREAQKQVVAVARRMSDEGTIVLAGRGGEEIV